MTQTLYQTDFYRWTQQQAALLRNEEYAQLDLPNLIEEIEAMGKSDKREVESRLTVILEHLLKFRQEPKSRARNHWRRTVQIKQIDLARLLRENHTLRTQINNFIDDAYQDARKLAATGINRTITTIPPTCPWAATELLAEDWWPTSADARLTD